jgi:hypothetical protein
MFVGTPRGGSTMFEYRFYEVSTGRVAEEVARMGAVAFDPLRGGGSLFDHYGIPRPLAEWTAITGSRLPLYGYLLHWDSLKQRDSAFPPFWADPTWHGIRDRTDADGPLVERMENWLLAASPAWNQQNDDGSDAALGGLHEMRIHHTLAGYSPHVTEYLRAIELHQLQVLGAVVLGVFDVLIGPNMPAIVSFLAWPDFETHQFAMRRLDSEPRVKVQRDTWKREHGQLLVREFEQTLLRPVPRSLPHRNFGRSR